MRDPIDTIKPWTIKAVSVEARDLAVVAARRDGLTVGQWLERVIRDAVDESAPVANKSAGPDVVMLAPLVPSMPRWLRAALWRRVARQMGVEAPGSVRKNPLTPPTLSAPTANPPGDEPNAP